MAVPMAMTVIRTRIEITIFANKENSIYNKIAFDNKEIIPFKKAILQVQYY